MLRTSERNDFKRCPWLWHESWIKGLRPRKAPTWSWFGTAIHAGLEARYPVGTKRGSRADMLDAFVEALDNQTRKVWTEVEMSDEIETEIVDAEVLGKQMLLGYVEQYGDDTEWDVLHTEQPFQIDVPDPVTGRVLVVYAGTWDLAVQNRRTKDYWLVDHKTRKTFLRDWSYLSLNDQSGSYLWVGREILRHLGIFKKKDVLEGIIFNYLRKALPDDRPVDPSTGLYTNKPRKEHFAAAIEAKGYVIPPKATLAVLEQIASDKEIVVYGDASARQPGALYHREPVYRSPQEHVAQARRVMAEAQWQQAILDGTLPLYKTPTEECPRCILFEYCQLDESSTEEGQEFAASMLVRRDPYRDHREAFDAGDGISLHHKEKGKK